MRTKEAIQERKAERAAQEAAYFSVALRFVESRLKALSPGLDSNHRTYRELLAEKDELTRRVEQATLESKGRCLHEKPCDRTFSSNVILSRGGTRRT